MDQRYDIAIIGGGIIGLSIAYHLTKASERSVALFERSKFTSGTTWHAAGLVAELRATPNLTRLAKYTGALFEQLQEEGEALGFRRSGALTLATNPHRAYELKKLAAMARHNDVDCTWLAPAALAERWPALATADLVGGVYMPRDGMTNPVDTTMALARLARRAGAQLFEDTPVTRLVAEEGRVHGVVVDGVEDGVDTRAGEITVDQVIVCAGLWSRDLGLTAGAHFPLYAAEHFYAVTESVSVADELPIVRVPDDGIYIKPEPGRLLLGCFEREAKPIATDALPPDFSFGELPFDLEHFAPYLEAGLNRIPEVSDVGIRTWFNGPESFTPDGRYLLGESPEVEGLFVAAGFNSIGIQSAGGVGQVMADWLERGHPPMDLWEVDVRRFAPWQNDAAYLRERTAESLGRLYAMHWPYFQHESARGQRQSPAHAELAAAGACFGELAGWERANWYAQPGDTPRYEYSYGRQNWFENARAEHHAVRNDVALFDQTSFAKYEIVGADACRFLNHLCTANVDQAPGKVIYCQWLNERGGIEADVTVTRLDETRYWVVSAAACAVRDLSWLARHRRDYQVEIREITDEHAVLGVMGPAARKHLQQLTAADLADTAFPFATAQTIEIDGVPVHAARLTYVGELGWELYVPWQETGKVFTALTRTPIKLAGYHAMDSLRLEKAYRHWGHDLSDEDTLLEAGLSFTADWDKDFIGRAALERQKAAGLTRRLTLFQLLDEATLLTHDEPIWQDGRRVGHIVSSAYSYQFNCSLGFGYVSGEPGFTRKSVETGNYTIEVGDHQVPAKASLRALYDPDNMAIRRG